MDKEMRILQLEDLETDAILIEREAKKVLPFSTFLCVETKEDFLTALTEFCPDIILSDYRLPHFDGLSALKLSKEYAPEIPFIIVTGSLNEDIAVECMKAGATDYVIKEHLKRLEGAIRNALQQRELRQQKKYALEALNESEERYRKLFEFAPVGILVLVEGEIAFSNPAARDLLGAYSIEQLLGLPISEIIHPGHLEQSQKRFQRLEQGEGGLFPTHDLYQKRDGSTICVEIMASLLTYNHKTAIQVIITNITERKKAEEELVYLSYHDFLTGLYNRRFFEEELKQMDLEDNLPIAVIIGDVNGLKLVNDSFGHTAGDTLLMKAAESIRNGCRQGDIAARIGGDEFALLLPRTGEEEVEAIVRKIKEPIFEVKLNRALLSISFGYGIKSEKSQNLQEVITEAENYMYKYKLYESLSMRSKTIDVIMNALYEKSEREMLHSKRVSSISAAIATEMGFQKYEINKIRLAGLVHDIGKMGIDEKILNKPSRLDKDEWSEMKKHPEAGFRILASANEFSDLAHYILSHHERWDGLGYPRGLKGEESPLESRIIAVSDSYDAMTSKRAYKEAASQEQAISELDKGAGSQFDPFIVDVFINRVLKNNYDFSHNNSLT